MAFGRPSLLTRAPVVPARILNFEMMVVLAMMVNSAIAHAINLRLDIARL